MLNLIYNIIYNGIIYYIRSTMCFVHDIETQNKHFWHVHETTLNSTELTAFKEEHNLF